MLRHQSQMRIYSGRKEGIGGQDGSHAQKLAKPVLSQHHAGGLFL
jgi:hypothetical protein